MPGFSKLQTLRQTFGLLACAVLMLLAAGLLMIQVTSRQYEVLCVRDVGNLRFLLNPQEIFGGTILSLNHRPVFAIHLGPAAADLEVFKVADIGQRTLIRRRTSYFEVDKNYYGTDSFGMSVIGTYFQAPFWFLYAVLLSYPVLLLLKRTLFHTLIKTLPNLCVKCGYNLSGLTDQRCPECGTSFSRLIARSGQG